MNQEEGVDGDGPRRLLQDSQTGTDSLEHADTKHVLFCGSSFLLLGFVWLGSCITLYVYGSGFHVNVPYEGRWFLSLLLLVGVVCICLHYCRCETSIISCALSCIYAMSGCILALIIYSINLNMALDTSSPYKLRPSLQREHDNQTFMQVSSIMITLSVFSGFLLCPYLLNSLYRLCKRHYTDQPVSSKLLKYILAASISEFLLACYSIYVTSQIISIKFSPIHTYMVQELFCGILLLITCAVQWLVVVTQNRLFLKFLMFLNLCHFFQELFYAWNAYYISLYIHSSQCLPESAGYDRLLHMNTSRSVNRWVVGLAVMSLCLGACHVLMDITYATLEHLYRTLIAFTGISVFYCCLLGVSVSLFVRTRQLVFFSLAAVFSILLVSVSLHGIYIYLLTAFNATVVHLLENLGLEKLRPSILHFLEALMSFFGLILSLVVSFVLLRILRMHSKRESVETLGKPVIVLRYAAWIILGLNIIETGLLLRVKTEWKTTDTTLCYAVLDVLATFLLTALQLAVTAKRNKHIYLTLLTVFFLLLSEVLTTFNYLSAYTTYTQLLIMLSRVTRPESTTARSASFNTFFPISQLAYMLTGHVIQIAQWILTIVSLVSAGMCLEIMCINRRSAPDRVAVGTNSAGDTFYINMAYDARNTDDPDTNGAINNNHKPTGT